MTDLKEVSYENYDSDKVKALCTVCVDDKHLISYAKKIYENREWWAVANHFFQTRDGKKVSVEGYIPESRSMDKQIKDFLEKCEKAHSVEKPKSMDGVAEAQGLPF
jgi:N-glycosylase/DNA lyase